MLKSASNRNHSSRQPNRRNAAIKGEGGRAGADDTRLRYTLGRLHFSSISLT